MYSITDYILHLVKTLPKEPIDFSRPASDQIDYEDHESIVSALYNGIRSGYVSFDGRAWDLRNKCERYVVSVMTNSEILNPVLKKPDNIVPNSSDFILEKLIDSLNQTDPESLLFKQLEEAIERRRNVLNLNVSKTN